MSADPTRDASDREILAELVMSSAWGVVTDLVRERAKALKNQVFQAEDLHVADKARYAHGELRVLLTMIYKRAGEKDLPKHVASIFD